jgi:hypothetical protein
MAGRINNFQLLKSSVHACPKVLGNNAEVCVLGYLPVRGWSEARPPPSRQGIFKEEPPSPDPTPTVLFIFQNDPDGTRGPSLALSSSLRGLGGKGDGPGIEAIGNCAKPQSLNEPPKDLAYNLGLVRIHRQLRAQGEGVSGGIGAAGGHFDPAGSKRHSAPWGDGHLGDLPALSADANGNTSPVLAPRLKMADLKGRALMIHTGGDNYADQPAPLGGGGIRWACGVIQAP